MELKQLLLDYREKNRISQREFARRCGLSNSLISILEMGINPQTGRKMSPDLETYKKLAAGMGTTVQSMFETMGNAEYVDIVSLPASLKPITADSFRTVPLIGSVAAGQPIPAEESIEMYIDSPSGADYALRVQGDSMSPTYLDGDIVYIKMTPAVTEGTVAVVLVDDDACLKHVYYISNGLQLVSDNPSYPPMIVTWPEHDNIRVLGKVIGYTRMYK